MIGSLGSIPDGLEAQLQVTGLDKWIIPVLQDCIPEHMLNLVTLFDTM